MPHQGVNSPPLSLCSPALHLRTPCREVPSQVVALGSLLLAAEVLYVVVYFTMALRAFSYLRSRWVLGQLGRVHAPPAALYDPARSCLPLTTVDVFASGAMQVVRAVPPPQHLPVGGGRETLGAVAWGLRRLWACPAQSAF